MKVIIYNYRGYLFWLKQPFNHLISIDCLFFTLEHPLKAEEIKISMDGRGRVFDNIFIERLWRSLKYEDVYIKDYETGEETIKGIGDYLNYYNDDRPYQSLNYQTPSLVYFSGKLG